MNAFSYKKGRLHAENVALDRIAAKTGTPVFVYSLNHFRRGYRAIRKALGRSDSLVCYSMKANSNLAVLSALAKEGAGFDIVSAGELDRLRRVKADMGKVVFAGVGKQAEEIRAALKAGIYLFTVESWPEALMINKVAGSLRKKARVDFRLNPNVDAKTHAYTTTGKKENKFGMPMEDALEIFAAASKLPNLLVSGVHIHIGSQITQIGPFQKAARIGASLVKRLRAAGHAIHTLDFGGGLGIPYNNERIPSPAAYVRALTAPLKGLGVKVILEPGRFLSGNAGVLVTQVTYLKKTKWKTFAIVDAAMNDLIRPALYGGWHGIKPLRRSSARAAKVDVVGPICESADFLAKDRRMPVPKEGDLLAVESAGAYAAVMGGTYNGRPMAPEVLVDGSRWDLVRKRQSYSDLVRGEAVPARLKVKR